MKKIFAAILLIFFLISQASFAGEVIIIGSDGQPRWEDITKQDCQITNDILKTTKKIIREVTVISGAGIIKKIYIDANGKIGKTEQSEISKKDITVIEPEKDALFQNHVKKAPKILVNTNRILREDGYKQKDDSSKNKKEYVKMNLLDGDYAIMYKDSSYIAEYHKNGRLMGLIEREDIVSTDKNVLIAFYEYRLGYNTEDDEAEDDDMGLKHILFLDMEKNKYVSQYIYLSNGVLLCRQINNNIYISEDAKNLLPDWSKKVSNKNEIKIKKYERTSRKALRDLVIVTTAPSWIIPPVGLIFFTFGSIIGGKSSFK